MSSSCSSSNRSRCDAGRMPKTMSRICLVVQHRTALDGPDGTVEPDGPGLRRREVEVRCADGHGVAQQVVDVERHGAVAGLRRDPRLEQLAQRREPAVLGRGSAIGPSVDQRRLRSRAGGGGTPRSAESEQLGDDRRVGQHGIDPVARPCEPERRRPPATGGSAKATASTLPSNCEGDRARTARATASGMADRASGLGVIAARSTAGSWARWASAPTTTPGSARFLLISMEASDWPVCLGFLRPEEPGWTRCRSHPGPGPGPVGSTTRFGMLR